MRGHSPVPETLFERIVDPVARARGGLYLSAALEQSGQYVRARAGAPKAAGGRLAPGRIRRSGSRYTGRIQG